jgi:UDP-glucose 4-epimerase
MDSYCHTSDSSSVASYSSDSLSSSPEPTMPHVASTCTDQDFLRHGTEYILVVGGLGFIGSHTALELLKEGYNVIIIDDLSNSYANVFSKVRMLAVEFCQSHGRSLPSFEFHQRDYRSQEMRHLLERYVVSSSLRSKDNSSSAPASTHPANTESCRSLISGVIHFAAFKSVEDSIMSPLAYYQNNVCGLVQFLILLREFGITNLIFSSSATVYGVKTNEGKPLTEDDVVHHSESHVDRDGREIGTTVPGVMGLSSPYGRTKWMCEAILADVAIADPTWRITALRYFNPVGCHESGILGEHPRTRPTNLFPVIAQVLTGVKPILHIFGSTWGTRDGTPVRDFIHVTDLARGHVAALAAPADRDDREAFRTYNLGTGKGYTVLEVVKSFEAVSGCQIPLSRVGPRPGDVGFCVAATARVERELGWRAEKSLLECARDTWNCISKASANAT